MRHQRGNTRTVQALLAPAAAMTLTLLAACSPVLAADPHYALDSGARPQGVPATTTPPPPGPAAIEKPTDDLSWTDCTSRLFGQASVPAVPGVTLECASYDAELDPIAGATGTLSIGVVRAQTPDTPTDAGPLVMTTGSDLPSSVQLPQWLSRSGSDILKTRPIVAVDRRGMGLSEAVDCRDTYERQEMQEQSQFEAGDDPVANLGAVTMTATTSCTDTIAPGDSAYDNAHAAEDLEQLRSQWDVPSLALLGVGNGAQVALAYAGSHPNRVARLALDSSLPLALGAEAAAEQRVKGQQAALDAFAAQCVAANCPLGPDPKGAIDALLAEARAGNGPGGASVATLTNAIVYALGFPQGDRVASANSLAATLAAARAGDVGPISGLIATANAALNSDGRFVNSCSDALNRPTPDRVRQLVVEWGKRYPQFGAVGALDLVKCLNWPSGNAPADPKDFTVPVLLFGVQNDPIIGNEGTGAVAASIINAGSNSRRVMWQGIGHGATIYSPCALPALSSYIDSGKLAGTDTFCPA